MKRVLVGVVAIASAEAFAPASGVPGRPMGPHGLRAAISRTTRCSFTSTESAARTRRARIAGMQGQYVFQGSGFRVQGLGFRVQGSGFMLVLPLPPCSGQARAGH